MNETCLKNDMEQKTDETESKKVCQGGHDCLECAEAEFIQAEPKEERLSNSDTIIDVDDEEKAEEDGEEKIEEDGEEKNNPRQLKYYVVRNVDASFVSKKEAARFIEDEIDAGKEKEKFAIVKGKQLELNFEVKTKVVIR
jgi:hypothetical protein